MLEFIFWSVLTKFSKLEFISCILSIKSKFFPNKSHIFFHYIWYKTYLSIKFSNFFHYMMTIISFMIYKNGRYLLYLSIISIQVWLADSQYSPVIWQWSFTLIPFSEYDLLHIWRLLVFVRFLWFPLLMKSSFLKCFL